jgi:YbbR domain-containing protein
MAEIGYQVPIEFYNLSPDLEISGDVPAQVYVRVRGRSVLLRRLMPADLAIRVDLTGKTAGETAVQFAPDQITPRYGASVVRISPAQLRLRLVTRKETSPAPPR